MEHNGIASDRKSELPLSSTLADCRGKKLRELIVDNTLRTFISSAEPPSQLVQEIGPDLAELLHAAKQSDGRVIRPLPIHRIQTFMEEEANLGEYASLVMTTLQFVDVLETDAVLDRHTSDRARRLLAPLEQREPLGTNKAGERPRRPGGRLSL